MVEQPLLTSTTQPVPQHNYLKIAAIFIAIIISLIVILASGQQRLWILGGIVILAVIYFLINPQLSRPDAFKVIQIVKDKVYKEWGAIIETSPEYIRIDKRGVYYILITTVTLDREGTDPVRYKRAFKYNTATGILEGIDLESTFEFAERLRSDTFTQTQIEKGTFQGEEKRFQ